MTKQKPLKKAAKSIFKLLSRLPDEEAEEDLCYDICTYVLKRNKEICQVYTLPRPIENGGLRIEIYALAKNGRTTMLSFGINTDKNLFLGTPAKGVFLCYNPSEKQQRIAFLEKITQRIENGLKIKPSTPLKHRL